MAIVRLPPMKLPYKKKGKKWRIEVMDAIDKSTSYRNNELVRNTMREKWIHADLYDGKLNMADVAATISSAGVLNAYIPRKIEHRPIIRPKIELLVGEAAKEPFSWSVMVTDPNSISAKKEKKKEIVNQKMMQLLESDYSDEELKAKLKDLELYFKYTWKDAKEVRATKILKYFYQKLKMDTKYNECMVDKLTMGEEHLMFDIVGGTVVAHKLDPKRVFTIHSGESNKVSDADIILIEEYWPVGRIVDHYYDELTSAETDKLLAGEFNEDSDTRDSVAVNMSADGVMLDNIINDVDRNRTDFSSNSPLVDNNGNYRVLRALFRSQKLVYEVTGVDPESGEDYTKIMSEEYVVNPSRGETLKKMWVGEWWQGAKIGSTLYKAIKPRPAQLTSIGNASKGHPGIVGYYNSVSGGKVVSFLSKLKPFQYLYDITWDRLLDALKKDLGNIVEMDMAKKPAGWETGKWLNYAYKGGILFVDSFKEATKGAATGRLSGSFNTTGKTISTSNGNYIQQHVNLLEYIKKEMGDVVGVTPQREGAIAPSATVGSTERSVLQSNNSTYYEFYMHEQFKLECLQVLLETAKVALRNNKDLAQIVLDDFSIEMFNIEGDDFIDSDYGVFLTTSKKSKEVQKSLEVYSQAFMQNGGNFSTILDILFSDSIAEKRRKIELAEADMKQEAQAQRKAESDTAQQALAAKVASEEDTRELKKYEIDENNRNAIEVELLRQNGGDQDRSSRTAEASVDADLKMKDIESKERISKNKTTVQQ